MNRNLRRLATAALAVPMLLCGRAQAKKAPRPTSISTANFTGKELTPVTLPTGAKIPRSKLLANVNKKTALIVFRNFSGKDLTYFGAEVHSSYGFKFGSSVKRVYSTSFHGEGVLLNGEQRIIKVQNRKPLESLRIVWSNSSDKGSKKSWNSVSEGFKQGLKTGTPIVFTVNRTGDLSVHYSGKKATSSS
ncbi:MAG TPA: hypothetical protein VF681_10430 [Abditibacteriaceae bacterium]|jgi:hypothetical protein